MTRWLLALDGTQVVLGVLGFLGVAVTTVGGVITYGLNRDTAKRERVVRRTTEDFEGLWQSSRDIMKAQSRDIDYLKQHASEAEDREVDCRRRLERVEAELFGPTTAEERRTRRR